MIWRNSSPVLIPISLLERTAYFIGGEDHSSPPVKDLIITLVERTTPFH